MRMRLFLLAAFPLALSQAQYAPDAPLKNQAADLADRDLKEGLVLGTRGGMFELQARGISLGMLFEELRSKGAVQAKLTTPSLASCSVNVKYPRVLPI